MSKQADVISCGQDLNTSSGVLSVSLYSAHQTEGRDGRQEGEGGGMTRSSAYQLEVRKGRMEGDALT